MHLYIWAPLCITIARSITRSSVLVAKGFASALKGRAGLAMAQMMSHKSGLKPVLHSSCKSHEAGCFSSRHGNLLFLLLHRKIKLHSRRWVQLRWLAKAPSLRHRLILPAKGVFLLEERKASPPLGPEQACQLSLSPQEDRKHKHCVIRLSGKRRQTHHNSSK